MKRWWKGLNHDWLMTTWNFTEIVKQQELEDDCLSYVNVPEWIEEDGHNRFEMRQIAKAFSYCWPTRLIAHRFAAKADSDGDRFLRYRIQSSLSGDGGGQCSRILPSAVCNHPSVLYKWYFPCLLRRSQLNLLDEMKFSEISKSFSGADESTWEFVRRRRKFVGSIKTQSTDHRRTRCVATTAAAVQLNSPQLCLCSTIFTSSHIILWFSVLIR